MTADKRFEALTNLIVSVKRMIEDAGDRPVRIMCGRASLLTIKHLLSYAMLVHTGVKPPLPATMSVAGLEFVEYRIPSHDESGRLVIFIVTANLTLHRLHIRLS